MLLPAFTGIVMVLVDQAVHVPVAANALADCTVAPLTTMLAERVSVPPWAYRIAKVAVPALAAFTVNWAEAPTALLALQNPEPEYPAWFVSMVPSQTAGAVSAS